MADAPARWHRRIQKPWVTAALLVALFADAVWISNTSWWAMPLEGVRKFVLRTPPIEPRIRRHRYIAHGTDGWRFVEDVPNSVHGVPDPASFDYEVWVDPSSTTTGRWAPTIRHFDSRLGVFSVRSPVLSSPDRDQIRELFAKQYDVELEMGPYARLLRQPERSNAEVAVPSGYIHNALALVGLAVFSCSLGWAPRLVSARVRASRRARGLCPRCCYEVRGLPVPICPECGTPIG